MSEKTPPDAVQAVSFEETQATPKQSSQKDENFFVFIVKLVLIIAIFRSFFFSPFNIPSESMLPRLLVGDYLLAAKWPYGYSKYSLPFNTPLIPGRIFPSTPELGDVAIVKAPPTQEVDYIKRVVGLPGDQVQMIDGLLHLNGKALPRKRIEDFEVAVSPNTACFSPQFTGINSDGDPVCRYPQYQETMPNGRSYNILDLGTTPQDNTPPFIVPKDSIFLMGDNRDNSLDSRFPAEVGKGIGIVPQINLVGRASIMMFSTDGSAEWLKPWTWLTATRWNRIGGTF